MLTFYQMHRLLEKNRRRQQRYNEADEGRRKRIDDFLASLGQGGTGEPVAPAAGAQKPVDLTPPAAEEAPPAASTTPRRRRVSEPAAQTPATPPVTPPAAGATPPPGVARLPTIVSSGRRRQDIDASRKTFEERIGDINRRLRYRNRGVGNRSRRYNVLPSGGIGKSDFAAELQDALEKTGVRMTGHELGEPFQISIGTAGNNIDTDDVEARHLPELVLTRGQLTRALAHLRRLNHVEGDDEYMDPADTFDTTDTGQRVRTGGGNPLFRQLGPIAQQTQGNPREHAVVERAYEIINKLPEHNTMAPLVALGAKPIKKFAQRLELVMPKPKEADADLAGGLPGESPSQQLRKAGLGVPSAPGTAMFEEPDPMLDEKALVLVCQLVANSGEEYPFIKIESQGPVTPDTIISFVDPRAVGVADFHQKRNRGGVEDEELRNLGAPSAATTTPFGKESASKDAVQRSMEFIQQRRAEREARKRGGTPPQMSAESAQWMDIYNLMEHWGF